MKGKSSGSKRRRSHSASSTSSSSSESPSRSPSPGRQRSKGRGRSRKRDRSRSRSASLSRSSGRAASRGDSPSAAATRPVIPTVPLPSKYLNNFVNQRGPSSMQCICCCIAKFAAGIQRTIASANHSYAINQPVIVPSVVGSREKFPPIRTLLHTIVSKRLQACMLHIA